MQLGAFSISLAVKDLQASKAFYEKLGFVSLMDPHPDDWVILKNGYHIIGLFQGMFEKNMLTFNPGWDQDAGSCPITWCKSADPRRGPRVIRAPRQAA